MNDGDLEGLPMGLQASPCVLLNMISEALRGGVIKVQGGHELHRVITGFHHNSKSLLLVIHMYENSSNSYNKGSIMNTPTSQARPLKHKELE